MDLSDILNLRGKVAVVTGANGGLGFESAKALGQPSQGRHPHQQRRAHCDPRAASSTDHATAAVFRRVIDEGIENLWLVSEREPGINLDFPTALEMA